jgi:hypothetical protein
MVTVRFFADVLSSPSRGQLDAVERIMQTIQAEALLSSREDQARPPIADDFMKAAASFIFGKIQSVTAGLDDRETLTPHVGAFMESS